MKTWIAKIKDSGPWIVFFEIFVIAQLLLIFVFNLTHLKYEAGFDSSAAMAQAMEIWNQKSIFLKHWDYQSTLGLDSVIIPASIFYGITHNIFLAYGIADCLGVLLYIYIFRDIFKMLQLPKLVRMIVYVLLLTPYSLEPLGYMPMMFTGAAYYIIKVLIPIMLIDILLKIRLEIPVRRYLHILITYFAAVYLTALSCGLYLLICGLFPIILYELFTVICSGSFKNFLSKNTLLLSASLVIYGLGYASAKIYGADIFTNEMVLTTAENFVNNFAKCIVGIAELFGALPNQKIVVTSAFGIHYLSHMAAFLLFVIILIATIKTVHPLSGLLKNGQTDSPVQTVAGMVCCIIAVNLAVLILTDTTYGSETFEFRYHLIPVVSGFLIVGIGIGGLVAWLKAHPNPLIFTSAMASIAIIWLLCNIVFYYYYTSRNNYETSTAITGYVQEHSDCDLVYFIGDSDSEIIEVARIARLLENRLNIIDGISVGSFLGWGASRTYYDPMETFDKVIIVCTDETYDSIEPYYRRGMTKLGTVDDYTLYELIHILSPEEYEKEQENEEDILSEDESASDDEGNTISGNDTDTEY